MNRLLPATLAMVLIAVATFGLGSGGASAAPAGAAVDLNAYSQSCLPDGTVQVRFAWQPSGWGIQWFDISALNNNFAGGFLNAGPLASGHNSLEWNWLVPNTRYYVRVNTLTPGYWAPSDTITFVTGSCGGFTAPTGLDTTVINQSTIKFDWDRGQNNTWFCVDTALSSSDLTNFTGSFANWGCGTTATQLTQSGFVCGLTHYWRVFAWGPSGSGHSSIRQFTPDDCAFSAPDDIDATVLGPSRVKFDWDRGTGNLFFCVDTAQSEDDLTDVEGTFMNHGCGTTGETFTSNNVPCGVTSYWRVWAAGYSTTGYSEIDSFTTPACPITEPTDLDADTIDGDTIHFEWTKGVDNLSSCVDTAESESDLNGLTGTWQNHGCWTMDDELTVNGLDCGTTYYWRVFTRGSGGSSAASDVATAETAACP